MFKLLKSEDKSVLNNSSFVKNAVLYKDMLCFYEAYSQIMKHKDKLPNFCYSKGKEVCIEGICLLIKMYATEFKFETLKLTLDYLKVPYFAIASYAENDEVDREIIIKEFDDYRLASIKYCDEQKDLVESKQKVVALKNKEIKKNLQKSQEVLKSGKILSVISIVLFALSVLSIAVPVLVANYKPDNKVLVWSLAVIPVVGFIVSIALKLVSRKLINTSQDISFHIQTLKKNNEEDSKELSILQSKYYKVFCEKYEYKTCFPEIFSRYTKVLSINEILSKARKYKMLSYNIVYDIGRLFKSQQREIKNIVEAIESISFSGDFKQEFSEIYLKICDQDWLYYNAEIRLNFLKKFTDISEKDYDWKLDINGKRVSPFDVDIRELSREVVAFSSEKDIKLISAPLAELVKTNYFKNQDNLNFNNGYSIEELKKVKANYLEHFYRFDVLSKLSNVFYDKKENQKLKNIDFPITEMERVPTLVSLKLKLIENLTGLGNSDANVIKTISESLFKDASQDSIELTSLTEDDIDYPKFTAEKMEEFEEYYVYEVSGQKKIGYKVN